MAGNGKDKSDEPEEFDGDGDDIDFDSLEEEVTKASNGSKKKNQAWRSLEQRAENKWLDSQLADWDEYLDIN